MADISIRIKSDMAQAEKDFQSLAGVSGNLQNKIKKLSESFKAEQIEKFTDKTKMAAIAARATGGNIAAMKVESGMLRSEIQKLIKSGMNPQNDALKTLTSRYAVLQKELGETSSKTNSSALSFGKLTSAILGANLAQKALYAIKDGIGNIFTQARKLEDVEAAFTPLMGGAKKAKELVNQLNIAAAQTPYQFENISKVTQQLLPVMNQDIKLTVDTFKMLGDTAGGNAQKLESITRGYTKAMLKGKTDMESLNIIAEAGVPIYNELAKSMGYNKNQMADFFKSVSAGKVSTGDLTKAFEEMTSKGGIFYHGMILASQTTSGVLSTMSDNLNMVAAGIGQEFLPAIKEVAIIITEVAGSTLEWIKTGDNLKNMMSIIGYGLAAIAGGYAAYAIATGIATGTTFGFIGSVKALTIAMAANPIGAIAAIITAILIPAIIWLIKNWDTVKLHVIDFVDAGIEKFYELRNAIDEKVLGGIAEIAKALAETTGSKFFEAIVSGIDQKIEADKRDLESIRAKREENKMAMEELQAKLQETSEVHDNHTQRIIDNNSKVSSSYSDMMKKFKEILETMGKTEKQLRNEQIKETSNYFKSRAELESGDANLRLEYLRTQFKLIENSEKISADKRIAIQRGIYKAYSEIEAEQTKATFDYVKNNTDTMATLADSLTTIAKNTHGDVVAFATFQKTISMAQAAINTALAVSNALTLPLPPPFPQIAAGIALAAGIAQEVAIATTPIPSAQTGIKYTVPDSAQYAHDRYPVAAGPGETVQVTPRGESGSNQMTANFWIAEERIFSIMQKGFDSQEMNFTDKNIGQSIFT